ncbi:MAG: helix-turn-helix transcriptional regulator [Calditrichaeota bacterium]|nr:helix-turn-helix transcriptional regulator [Calditrichota bacterium]
MTINEAFGQVLKEELDKQQIRRVDFAKQTRMSRQYVYRMTKGQHSPSLDTILIIANALNVDFTVLMERTKMLLNKA